MLAETPLIAFVPTNDRERARAFYGGLLGLPVLSEDAFALVVSANGTPLRIVQTPTFTPTPYTILGWEVTEIGSAVEKLTAAGVSFVRFPFLEQDAAGIWTAPGGVRVAWFHDPDGNTLSLSQHA